MFALLIFDEDTAREQAAPFLNIHNVPVAYMFAGVHVFGPYQSQKDASGAGRTLDHDRYTWAVRPMRSLSEDLDNPGGALFQGDAPDA